MTKQYQNICERITNKIIEFLDKGVVPWQKPWIGGHTNAPRSVSTTKVYRGTNLALLSCASYDSPWWLTFGQAKKLDGLVRKGEKSFPVSYWKFPQEEDCPKCKGKNKSRCSVCDSNGRFTAQFARLFSFNVFNASQCEGLPEKYYARIEDDAELVDFEPIEKAEKIVNNYAKVYTDGKLHPRSEKLSDNPPSIRHDQCDRNYYAPYNDEIHLTRPEQFISVEEYYSTTFHEMVHSTGHESRLAREGVVDMDGFGSHKYSKEELVAEMGSTYLCGISGIAKDEIVKNSASYIQSWKKKLDENKDWIVWSGTRASKAVDHILGTEYGK